MLAATEREASQLFAQVEAEAAASDIVSLEVVLNGQPSGTAFIYTGSAGMAIEEAALRRWRIDVPPGGTRDIEGRRYLPVAVLGGVTARIEMRTQRLLLTVPPNMFEPNSVALATASPLAPAPPVWSAFANYDLFGYSAPGTHYGSGLFEVGTSGPYGTGIVSAVANSAQAISGTTGKTVLLEADWRRDDPASLRTLILGTAVNRTVSWGQALRFVGAQYGTNFTIRPDLITYPLPAFPGTAVVPSTVDVFVNGSRTGAQQVASGPFSISNVPIVTGAGEVQLVVRDAFGQQQVITQPFYASQQLLAPGLDDFNVSAGRERLNYGSESLDLGSGFFSGYWRRGLTDTVTVSALGEGDSYARAAGAAIDFIPGRYGVVTLGAAASDSRAGTGYLGLAGYQYQNRRFNVALQSSFATSDFRMPGGSSTIAQTKRLLFANLGFNFGAAGTLGFAWVDQQYLGAPSNHVGTVSYSVALTPRLSFVASVSNSQGTTSQTTAFATLIFALGENTSAAADVTSTRSNGSTHTVAGATLQRTLPIGEGYGYRLRATTDDQYEAGATYAGPWGRYSVDVAHAGGVSAARAEVAGGIGTADGVVFAARPIVDSFAIVRIDGVPGINIYQNGNFAGRTDADGVAVLTQLYPYSRNRITINDKDAPIDVTLNTREQTIAPYYRSGAVADFGARRLQGAVLEIRLRDGGLLPSGAEVRRASDGMTYPVGANGEIYVPDLESGSNFIASWSGGRCRFSIDMAKVPREVIPRVGPLECAKEP